MAGIGGQADPNVLVGFDTADDAGVYLLDEKTALVQTADFFTPVVDDPFVYGQIAAANALSDIYAMGAEPRYAVALACFPEGDLDEEILGLIFRGGAEKMREAGTPVIGGHSVKDREIKFGYSVTGVVDPRRILRNSSARPGDRLLLTKPLGTGVIATAVKRGKCPPSVAKEAVDWMLRLNRQARDLLQSFQVSAVTDVTGYGLIGHAYEMALHSGVCLRLRAGAVPLIEGALGLAAGGHVPGGSGANRSFVGSAARWDGVDGALRQLLLDPQTSGGLLISAPASEAERIASAFENAGEMAVVVGEASPREEAYLVVTA